MALAVSMCCDEAAQCPGCGRVLCLDHTDTQIRCEVEGGLICQECHGNCTSVSCARENDPTCGFDVWFDEHLL